LVKPFRTVTLIVLDSVGIGGAPDAAEYNDEGADTLGHLAEFGKIKIENLCKLGIGNIRKFHGIKPADPPVAYYGIMQESSKGKGSTEGHWEIAGCVTEKPFALFPNGFPKNLIDKFQKAIGREVLGNCPASGTEIINRLGDEHSRSGKPIVYTSADSVFQIAAREDIVPLEQLYDWCSTARRMLVGEWNVVRVIARPFVKQGKKYVRTKNRKDFSVKPPYDTVLDILSKNSLHVIAIGKINDLFAGKGITEAVKTDNNAAGMKQTVRETAKKPEGLIFTNLVDFDMLYGHRNNPEGYINALEEFDRQLRDLIYIMDNEQLLIMTADHGCDPLYKGWDHTRERVPLLVYSPRFKSGGDLGLRETFADVGATLAENFAVEQTKDGNSFMTALN